MKTTSVWAIVAAALAAISSGCALATSVGQNSEAIKGSTKD